MTTEIDTQMAEMKITVQLPSFIQTFDASNMSIDIYKKLLDSCGKKVINLSNCEHPIIDRKLKALAVIKAEIQNGNEVLAETFKTLNSHLSARKLQNKEIVKTDYEKELDIIGVTHGCDLFCYTTYKNKHNNNHLIYVKCRVLRIHKASITLKFYSASIKTEISETGLSVMYYWSISEEPLLPEEVVVKKLDCIYTKQSNPMIFEMNNIRSVYYIDAD